jgi:hypothetical protein
VHSQGTVNPDHSRHDRLLVTRFAVGDAYPTEVADAQRLVDGCARGASLVTEIRNISTVTSQLPAIGRQRDFRISPEEAERLRGSWLERFMRGLSAPGWTVVRPLAGAAFAIGLALAVVGALPLNAPATETAADFGAGPMARNSQPVASVSEQPPAVVGAEPSANPQPAPSERPILAPETFAIGPVPSPAGAPPASPEYNIATQSGVPAPAQLASPTAADTNTKGSGGIESSPPDAASPPDATPPAVIEPPSAVPAVPTTEALVIPPAAPSAAPGPQDHAPIPAASAVSNDRPLLIAAGLALALLAVGLFLVVWLARRRYSDPLQR